MPGADRILSWNVSFMGMRREEPARWRALEHDFYSRRRTQIFERRFSAAEVKITSQEYMLNVYF